MLMASGQSEAQGDISHIISTNGDGLVFNNWDIASWSNLQAVEFVFPDIWTMPADSCGFG